MQNWMLLTGKCWENRGRVEVEWGVELGGELGIIWLAFSNCLAPTQKMRHPEFSAGFRVVFVCVARNLFVTFFLEYLDRII